MDDCLVSWDEISSYSKQHKIVFVLSISRVSTVIWDPKKSNIKFQTWTMLHNAYFIKVLFYH